MPSTLANRIIAQTTAVPLHDGLAAHLKLYRRSILSNIRLYGEKCTGCCLSGATGADPRIIEMPIHHRPRTKGKSKYGIGRTYKVLLDLLTTKFISAAI